MSKYTTSQSAIRELDLRTNDDIEVKLMWNSRTNHVFVTVEDRRTAESFAFTVSGHEARHAFNHPYAHRACGLLPITSADSA